jgi:hypothetical protein
MKVCYQYAQLDAVVMTVNATTINRWLPTCTAEVQRSLLSI